MFRLKSQNIFSKKNGIKLEIPNKKISEKPNICRLSNKHVNIPRVKE